MKKYTKKSKHLKNATRLRKRFLLPQKKIRKIAKLSKKHRISQSSLIEEIVENYLITLTKSDLFLHQLLA